MEDDSITQLYNAKLLALSAITEIPSRLPSPTYSATETSPICGSVVTIDLELDPHGKITAFGYAVEACALARTVVAIMKDVIIGKTKTEVAAAGTVLAAMLEGAPDVSWPKDWQGLAILQPVVEYKARHNSIMLAFAAIKAAFDKGE